MEDPRSRAERLLFSSHIVDRKSGAAELARQFRGTGDPRALRMLLSVAGNAVEHPLVRGEAHRAIAAIADDLTPAARGREEAATSERAVVPETASRRLQQLIDELYGLQSEKPPTQAGLLQAVSQSRGLLFGEPEPDGRARGAMRLGRLLCGTRDATTLRTLLSVLANRDESESVRVAAREAILLVLTDPFEGERSTDDGGWEMVRRLQEELYSGQASYGQGEWLLTYGNIVEKLLERIPELNASLSPFDPDQPHVVFDRLFDLVLQAAQRIPTDSSHPSPDEPFGDNEDVLRRGLDFIEEAVSSRDAHVANVVAVSFMERLSPTGPRLDLRASRDHRELVASRLGPASAKLLREVSTWWERFEIWTRSRE